MLLTIWLQFQEVRSTFHLLICLFISDLFKLLSIFASFFMLFSGAPCLLNLFYY